MSKAEAKFLTDDPLSEAEKILRDDFYGARGDGEVPEPEPAAKKKPRAKKPKPTHYKVVCISLYTRDIADLEAKVAELKRRGYTKANKSQLIRVALRNLDIDAVDMPQP